MSIFDPISTIEDCETFLELQTIKDRQFTTGLFHSGITIYKQQIRALNLFYAMHRTGLFNVTNPKVCVIGGGVSGLTFAAAASKANIDVLLLEKEAILIPLQFGCDIRTVHPNLYDWPEDGSTFPHAKLPVLSWVSKSASNISKQIFRGFSTVNSDNRIVVFTSVEDTTITAVDKKSFTITGKGISKQKKSGTFSEKSFHYIIYCNGFGYEKESQKFDGKYPSYWRNDNHSQIPVKDPKKVSDDPTKYYVSGSGDGALIDFFRLAIRGFSYETFLKKLYPPKPEESEASEYAYFNKTQDLIEKLKSIKQSWISTGSANNWLFDQFTTIKESFLFLQDSYFLDRIRKENKVYLVSESDVPQILNLDKISFLNAFILYILYDMGGVFKREPGKGLTAKDRNFIIRTLSGKKDVKEPVDILIPRHGTEKKDLFLGLPINENDISNLELKQKNKSANPNPKLWSEPNLLSLFTDNAAKGFCTNDTISVCSGFVSILNDLLCSTIKDDTKFRMTLHRASNDGGNYYYQQIAPYFGTLGSKASGVGRIFPISKGNVGLSFATGEPVFLRNGDGNDEIIKALHLEKSESVRLAKSFLSIPIYASLAEGKSAVNLILYIDSTSEDFFEDENRMQLIMSAAQGWIKQIHFALGTYIHMNEMIGEPLVIDSSSHVVSSANDLLIAIKKIKDTNGVNFYKDHKNLKAFEKFHIMPLKFYRYYSFDIYHNP